MLTITAHITAVEGKSQELHDKMAELIDACKDQDGLYYYSVHQCHTDPNEFIFYEHFRDRAAFDAHQASPEVRITHKLPQDCIAKAHIQHWTQMAASGSKSLPTVDALATRRSIRTFTDQDVSDETLQRILLAGMQAPSAGNAQPWEFVVIKSEQSKEHITKIHQYAQMAPKAPVSVLVCGNLSKEKYAGFWVQDCSAAIQNMLLAARANNVGTVWCGIHPIEERVDAFRVAFKLPEHMVPLGLVVMGYSDQPFVERAVFDESKIHLESF
ncbi:MAG: nitroreductase family protein [Pseudomonadota bacterium]